MVASWVRGAKTGIDASISVSFWGALIWGGASRGIASWYGGGAASSDSNPVRCMLELYILPRAEVWTTAMIWAIKRACGWNLTLARDTLYIDIRSRCSTTAGAWRIIVLLVQLRASLASQRLVSQAFNFPTLIYNRTVLGTTPSFCHICWRRLYIDKPLDSNNSIHVFLDLKYKLGPHLLYFTASCPATSLSLHPCSTSISASHIWH